MLNHNVNPLDSLVVTISNSRHLLTAQHLALFRELLPREKASPAANEKSTINELLGTLTSMVGNLQLAAAGATDPEGFKVIIGSIEKIMSMVNKYTDQVSQEEKLKALQDSIMETLNEMPDAMQTIFLDKWQSKINALTR